MQEKARANGIGSLTAAETSEWANLRGALSNIEASRDLVILRAQMTGGSEETSREIANIMGSTGIASAGGIAGGIGKGGKPSHANNAGEKNSASSHFPSNLKDLTASLGVEPKVSTTQHGTTRMVWEPNSNTRIRYESHPGDEGVFNPRHHGEHYHIEVKPDNLTWNQAKKQNSIQKVKPENYKPGHVTGFLPNEKHPGK